MAKSNSFFNIDMLVLSLLKVSDCYGYELVKKIKEVSNNTLDIKEGTLYPVVHNLLKKEYISSRDEIVNKKVRVYYHIEPIGKEYLEQTIYPLILEKILNNEPFEIRQLLSKGCSGNCGGCNSCKH